MRNSRDSSVVNLAARVAEARRWRMGRVCLSSRNNPNVANLIRARSLCFC